MRLKTINIICVFFLFAVTELKAQAKKDYNIIWTTESQNASESMPCGGGDIGMNVWVEKGDLLIYVARSGNFDENNALFKTGRIRIKLFPNVLDGTSFKQELHLQEGFVTVEGEKEGIKATVKIWADVFRPVAHFDISSNKKITAEATYESWRYQDRIVKSRENFGNSWKWGAPKNNVYRKDEIGFSTGGVLFYHHNAAKTIFDTTVTQQGLDAVKDQLYNPLKKLLFGGLFRGDNFIEAGETSGVYVNTDFKGWKLKSITAAKEQSLVLILHNQQVDGFGEWHQELKTNVLAANNKKAFANTQDWWKQFWNRSYINIDDDKKDNKSWQVGRNYQLFRYMLACNAHGAWPTKHNGGLLTVDPVYTDNKYELTPDYRNWGGGLHTAQNQRLVYFPMIKAGDWDMLQPQFDFYLRLLKNAELRSKCYWNHNGACFTEQMENYGLPDFVEYGQNRPPDFDKGLEYNAWLEYEWDTVLEFCLMMLEENAYTGKDISDKISFIESCLRFFDEHYQYLAKKRGAKALDGNGHLVLYPGSGAETYKMANNSTSTIAALSVVSKKLFEVTQLSFYKLPYSANTNKETDSVIIKRLAYLEGFIKRLPPISFQSFNGQPTISPAKTWERINNTEPSQLYPVFPWGIYGVGKPGLDTALNTWQYDTLAIKFRSHIGWKQDNIFAARLGLTEEAWKYTSLKLQDGALRFPAFWGPGYDWLPDHNWGGSGAIGLQQMLLQTDDKRILLFPAWPKDKDVHFKLHAPYNTTVEATLKDGKVISLIVVPEERKKDVEIFLK